MGNGEGVPIRCTQNPTIRKEWQWGWHSEILQLQESNSRVLSLGAGSAGTKGVHALGKLGYKAMLTETTRDVGGCVLKEANLPG